MEDTFGAWSVDRNKGLSSFGQAVGLLRGRAFAPSTTSFAVVGASVSTD